MVAYYRLRETVYRNTCRNRSRDLFLHCPTWVPVVVPGTTKRIKIRFVAVGTSLYAACRVCACRATKYSDNSLYCTCTCKLLRNQYSPPSSRFLKIGMLDVRARCRLTTLDRLCSLVAAASRPLKMPRVLDSAHVVCNCGSF